MMADVVVDIGNTRVKWGRCNYNGVFDSVALSYESSDWDRQWQAWHGALPRPAHWVVAGVVPDIVRQMHLWISERGDRATIIDSFQSIPLVVDVTQPETVGLDRLLGATAASAMFPGKKVLVVDAGSAVTVNLVDSAFRGGVIFPGVRLMSEALHNYTAKLPKIRLEHPEPFPGRNTEAAIRAGFCTVLRGAVMDCAKACQPDAIAYRLIHVFQLDNALSQSSRR